MTIENNNNFDKRLSSLIIALKHIKRIRTKSVVNNYTWKDIADYLDENEDDIIALLTYAKSKDDCGANY